MRLVASFVLFSYLVSPALAFDPFAVARIDQQAGATVPLDEPLRDAGGAGSTLRALAGGKPILLAPVLHHCPNVCGVTLGGLVQAVQAQEFMPGTDFEIVAFGIDPAETSADAAASLATLRKASNPAGAGIHAVTGTADAVRAITNALGYRYAYDERIGQYAHIAAVAAITPDGRVGRWLYGLAPDPTDLHLALVEAGEGRVGSWTDQLLLLCYHYDPQTGRYGPLVWTLLRAGGGATFLALLYFVGFALRRERRLPDQSLRRGQS